MSTRIHTTLFFRAVTTFGVLLVAGAAVLPAEPGSDSLVVSVVPGEDIAVRILAEPVTGVQLLCAGRSAPENQIVRAGVAVGPVLVGPVTLGGAFAELERPTSGSASSGRWLERGGLSLDRSLRPTSRFGLSLRSSDWFEGVAWYVDETVFAGVSVRGGRDGPLVRWDSEAVLGGSVFGAVADGDPAESGWFDGRHEPGSVAHGMGRVRVTVGRSDVSRSPSATIAGAALVSLPRDLLPGLAVRVLLRFAAFGCLDASVLAVLATPDFRAADRSLPGDRARLSARLAWEGRLITARADVNRRYPREDDAYQTVGFGLERLESPVSRFGAGLVLKLPGHTPAFRSLTLDAVLDLPFTDAPVWKATMALPVRVFTGRALVESLELNPSVTIASPDAWTARLRSTLTCHPRWLIREIPDAELAVTSVITRDFDDVLPDGFELEWKLVFRATSPGSAAQSESKE